MSLMDKIKKVLDEKVEDKEKDLLDNLDEDKTVDEKKDNPFDKKGDKDDKDSEDTKDGKKDDMKDDDDDKKDKKEKVDVKESLSKILAKAKIDESLVVELTTLFSAAVDEKVAAEYAKLEAKETEYMDEMVEELEARVDKYVSYAAEEWLKENEVEVEAGIKVEISENLIASMKGIFEDSYVEVPDSKVDLVKEAEETIDSLLNTIDENKAEIETVQAELNGMKTKTIVDEMSVEMTDTQKEKLATLTDSIEYENDSDYTEKVKVIIENYFGSGKTEDKKDKDLNEDKKAEDGTDDLMSLYVKHMRNE